MNMEVNTLKAIFSVNAVIFGTDESILGLNLCDGFSFQRKSLMPLKDHLDEVFETDAMGLRREYELARFDDSLDVICITKHTELDIPVSEAYDYFTKMADESLLSLDNQIRAIRLVMESPLRCKKIMFRLVQDKNTYEHLFSVNESMTTHEISRFHCAENAFDALSEAIRKISFPLSDKMLNIAHMHYDLSYHQNRYIAVTLLVAVLEMLYLNDEGAKKERLSKRCAIFLMEKLYWDIFWYLFRNEFAEVEPNLNFAISLLIEDLPVHSTKEVVSYFFNDRYDRFRELRDDTRRRIEILCNRVVQFERKKGNLPLRFKKILIILAALEPLEPELSKYERLVLDTDVMDYFESVADDEIKEALLEIKEKVERSRISEDESENTYVFIFGAGDF